MCDCLILDEICMLSVLQNVVAAHADVMCLMDCASLVWLDFGFVGRRGNDTSSKRRLGLMEGGGESFLVLTHCECYRLMLGLHVRFVVLLFVFC